MALTMTYDEAIRTLNDLEDSLRDRVGDNEKFQKYYDGDQRLKFASAEFRTWFEDQYEGFADNWCAPVVDATVERLKFEGIRPHGSKDVDMELHEQWERNSGPAQSKLAFQTSAITGRVFAMVWGDDEGNPVLTFEHPSQCIVSYEPGTRKRKAGAKVWQDGSNIFANLYTDDYVWKFQKRATSTTGQHTSRLIVPDSFVDWSPRSEDDNEPWPLPNPLGEVPLVELQNRPKLNGDPLNEISGVAKMQDAVNALWSYLFTSADFAALPQRVILGAQLPKIPILNDEGKKIGEKPIDLPEANIKRILNIEGEHAKIAQWDAAKLDIFTGVIERAVSHIANQTRTPLHYFASSVQNISGDTLKALETGLVAKISDRKMFYDDPIRDIMVLMALVMGNPAKAESLRAGTVMWSDHEARSDAQAMDKLVKQQTLGFPFQYILEQYVGGDPDEIERIMAMRKDEAANDPLSMLGQQMQGLQDQQAGQGNDQAAKDGAKKGGGSDNGETTATRAARAS